MLLSDPDQLHSLYARAMMAWLLFKDQPGEVLMIGLGGGSLAKFLLQRFEDCKIKVLEYRRGVVKIARSHFSLPLDPRLKIKIGDGGHYVRQKSLTLADEVLGYVGPPSASGLISLLALPCWTRGPPILYQGRLFLRPNGEVRGVRLIRL